MGSNSQTKLESFDSAAIFEVTFNLINQINNGIVLIDRQFQVLLWNDWLANMTHRRKTQAIGVSLFKLFPALQNSKLESAIQSAFRDHTESTLMYSELGYLLPLYTQDTTKRHMPVAHNIVVKPVVMSPGNVFCLLEVHDCARVGELEHQLKNQSLELKALTSDATRYSALNEQLLDNSYTGILKTDKAGVVNYCNPVFTKLYGYQADQVRDVPLHSLIRTKKGKALKSFQDLNTIPDDQLIYLLDAGQREIPVNLRLARNDADQQVSFTAFICDQAKQLQTQIDLDNEKSRAEAALESIADAVITCNAKGVITYLNSAAQQLTAWSIKEAMNAPLHKIINLCDEETLAPIFLTELVTNQNNNVEYPKYCNALLVRRDHLKLSVEYSMNPLRSLHSDRTGYVVVLHDVSRAHDYARKLAWQSTHDALTGLVNRVEFERRIEQLLKSAKDTHSEHTFIYIDIDQFKIINESCGHLAGDELLRQISGILKNKLRPHDVVARLGGDEFGILMTNCLSAVAHQTAEQIKSTLNEFRFNWNGQSFAVAASMGIVEINEDSESTINILSTADAACFAAKDNGRNRVYVYDKNYDAVDQHRGEMRWVSRIQRALDWDDVVLFGQPIVPLHPAHRGQRRMEILVRLTERNGVVMPSSFIPAAERFNLMPKIDHKVIEKTLAYYKSLDESLREPININLSGLSIGNDYFLNFLLDQIQTAAIDPYLICFEITETAAIQNISNAANFMRKMKSLGCQFALDDFGSGLSSFSYLKNLPIDFLKIDGTFVREIDQNPVDYAMVEAINQIGHTMGLRTIAEFVETKSILDKIGELGIDFAQGFEIEIPKPLDEHYRKNK